MEPCTSFHFYNCMWKERSFGGETLQFLSVFNSTLTTFNSSDSVLSLQFLLFLGVILLTLVIFHDSLTDSSCHAISEFYLIFLPQTLSLFVYSTLPLCHLDAHCRDVFGYSFLQTRLQEEHERCLIYLDASTKKPLIATAEKQLLERHIPAILDKVLITSILGFL